MIWPTLSNPEINGSQIMIRSQGGYRNASAFPEAIRHKRRWGSSGQVLCDVELHRGSSPRQNAQTNLATATPLPNLLQGPRSTDV